MVVVCVRFAGVTSAETIRDGERGPLVPIITSSNNEAISIRLLVVVVLARGWVKLEIVAVAERVYKRVAISVEIACLTPFFGEERTEDVTSCVFDRQNRLGLILKLPKEGEVTIAILPCCEQELPFADAIRPWQMIR